MTKKTIRNIFKAEQRYLPCSRVSAESQGLRGLVSPLGSPLPPQHGRSLHSTSETVSITALVLTNPGSTSLSSSVFSQQHLTLSCLLSLP